MSDGPTQQGDVIDARARLLAEFRHAAHLLAAGLAVDTRGLLDTAWFDRLVDAGNGTLASLQASPFAIPERPADPPTTPRPATRRPSRNSALSNAGPGRGPASPPRDGVRVAPTPPPLAPPRIGEEPQRPPPNVDAAAFRRGPFGGAPRIPSPSRPSIATAPSEVARAARDELLQSLGPADRRHGAAPPVGPDSADAAGPRVGTDKAIARGPHTAPASAPSAADHLPEAGPRSAGSERLLAVLADRALRALRRSTSDDQTSDATSRASTAARPHPTPSGPPFETRPDTDDPTPIRPSDHRPTGSAAQAPVRYPHGFGATSATPLDRLSHAMEAERIAALVDEILIEQARRNGVEVR